MCSRSKHEAHLFPKYPRLPVLSCKGYEEKRGEESAGEKIAVDQNK